jgi:hypothetical protein
MQTVAGNLFVGDSGRFSSGYTPRTTAFLAATGITNSTIANALNVMDKAIIANNLQNDLDFLHPFVGSTASTCKYNFMDVTKYNCTFFGGVTFDANGITGNGTNGYANFGFTPSTNFAVGSAHVATYDRTNSFATGRYTIGALAGGSVIWISYFDSQYAYLGGGIGVSSNGNLGITKLRLATRTSTTTFKVFRDGLQVGTTATGSATTYPTNQLTYLAANSLTYYSNHNLAFGCGGKGLSDAKAIALNTIVNNFQTSLGRAV